jgi:hypothetical protein
MGPERVGEVPGILTILCVAALKLAAFKEATFSIELLVSDPVPTFIDPGKLARFTGT